MLSQSQYALTFKANLDHWSISLDRYILCFPPGRLLSAGQDRAFRVFSTIQDQQSRELSQHHTARRAKKLKIREEELKLPRVVAMDACDVRERDWCNVITAHDGDCTAYTWRLQHFTLGDQMLR